ncbi:MAG: ATP-binding protein [Gemmatimonadota bacterium]|nr:ATP-binding protein [Gemmatimonadota bacterium]
MTLARRLLTGALFVVVTLIGAVVLIAGGRLRDRLVLEKTDELSRAARLVSKAWTPRADADAIASASGEALGYRVTLIDTTGVVIGDSEFSADARRRLENHFMRPEVVGAREHGVGFARRNSASAGDEELYVAVRHPLGTVRVSMTTVRLDAVVRGAQLDVLASGLVALVGAVLLVWAFARTISQPVVELRDVARAIAAGDLSRRPALSAPGEIGDLATALNRMAEQLSHRMLALQKDDQLMTALLESLEEAVLAFDPSGAVVRINERGRVLLAVQAPLPFGRELLPRDFAIRSAIDQALAGDDAPTCEVVIGDRTLAITSRPLPAAGAVLTLLDLTVLRRLETVRRDFVANVSHELKTPLTAVNGYAETLLDETIPAEQRQRFVETIRDNALRMQRIVDDLLDLSRIESGTWRPNVTDVDVASVVGSVFNAVAASAAKHAIDLSADIGSDAARLMVDSMAFRQVVANLVENAIQYTRSGSVTLRTRTDGDSLRLEVADTGVGIAPEHLPRIFERFYRVDAGRSREQGGTGLGLAIVRHLVDAHGGQVEAVSRLGVGTTIVARFPLRAAS